MHDHAIRFTYLSQEEFLQAGCLDFNLAIDSAEQALLAFKAGKVMFPDKIVQIFDQETQERINCLPATLTEQGICGVKWVSVFPPNVPRFGLQNLTAVFILSEIEKGVPLAFMEGTLGSASKLILPPILDIVRCMPSESCRGSFWPSFQSERKCVGIL